MSNALATVGGSTLKALTGGGYGSVGDAGSGPSSIPNLFYDGFESGDITAPASPSPAQNSTTFAWSALNRTSIVTGAALANSVIHPSVTVVNDTRDWSAYEGDNSMRFRWTAGTNMTEQRFTLAAQPELWLRYWVRVPTNYSHGVGGGGAVNNKFLSVFMDGYEGGGDGSTFWLSMESAGGGDTNLAFTYTIGGNTGSLGMKQHAAFIDASADQGRWMQMTVHIKAESSLGAADGIVQTYRRWSDEGTATKLHEKLDVPMKLPSSPVGFAEGYFFGWANGSYAVDTEWLLDTVELSTASLL